VPFSVPDSDEEKSSFAENLQKKEDNAVANKLEEMEFNSVDLFSL